MEQTKFIHIAIDGPSGAGKSTIAKRLAKELSILYLDTGAMYRAIGLKALRQNLDTEDESQIKKMLVHTNIDIQFKNGQQLIYLDDKDVTDFIRTPKVSKAASNVSKWPDVRIKLVELQRAIARENSVVMDGRDIGTYVLPNANYKFFLTASSRMRAKRRYLQLKNIGQEKSIKEIEKEIIARDKQDMGRDFAPLKMADDAYCVDTIELTIDEVVHKLRTIMGK